MRLPVIRQIGFKLDFFSHIIQTGTIYRSNGLVDVVASCCCSQMSSYTNHIGMVWRPVVYAVYRESKDQLSVEIHWNNVEICIDVSSCVQCTNAELINQSNKLRIENVCHESDSVYAKSNFRYLRIPFGIRHKHGLILDVDLCST